MLNIASGVYNEKTAHILPIPLIKEVIILPVDQIENGRKTIKMNIKIVLQRLKTIDAGPFNLHVSAITNLKKLKTVKSGKDRNGIRRLIEESLKFNGSKTISTNIGIVYDKNNLSPMLYNVRSGATVYNQTISVPLTVEFEDNIKDLCIVAATSESGGSKTDTRLMKDRQLKVSVPAMENIFMQGRTPSRANIFTLAETVEGYGLQGEVWSGPVHRDPTTKKLMCGSAHISSRHPSVVATKVPNLKIKDYRIFAINDFITPPPPDHRSRAPYLSDLSFSRSSNNSVKIFFSFDLNSFMAHNSDLAHLFKNKRSLLSTAQITNIKVYRQRIDAKSRGNRLTPDKSLPNNRCALDSNTQVASLDEKTVQLMLASASRPLGIYEILAIDNEMPDQLDSKFAYSLDFEIIDNSKAVIKEMLDGLRAKMAHFNDYLLPFSNFGKKGYNVETYRAAALSNNKADASWKPLLVEYVSGLLFLRGPQPGGFELITVLKNLMAMVDPSSATSESLLAFKELIQQYTLKLENTITKKLVAGTTAPISYRSKIEASSDLVRRIKFQPTINQIYFNDVPSSTGFDYLGPGLLETSDNFNQISIEQFVNRVSKEIRKYKVPNPNAPSVNKFGFLSPDSVNTPTGKIMSERKMEVVRTLDLLHANMLPVSKNKNFIGSPTVDSNKQTQLQGILSAGGVSYNQKSIDLRKLVQESDPAELSGLDVSHYFSDTSEFVFDKTAKADPVEEGSETLRFQAALAKSKNLMDTALVRKIVESAAQSFQRATPANIDNIKGSLAYNELHNTDKEFLQMNMLEKNINFNSIVRVEYFNGYKLGVKDLRWMPLDASVVEKIKGGKSLLCRLVTPGESLNVKNNLSLPKYDSLFVLGLDPLPRSSSRHQFERLLRQSRGQLTNMVTSGILNVKAGGGNVLTEYLCSDTMIYGVEPRRPTPRSQQRRLSTVGDDSQFREGLYGGSHHGGPQGTGGYIRANETDDMGGGGRY